METERIALSQRERDRLKVLHEVNQKQLTQVLAAERLKVTDRQVRRMLLRIRERGEGALVHGLRGRPSNRKLGAPFEEKIRKRLHHRYADFGPTLAAEHLAKEGFLVSRETLRKWMTQEALWRPRCQRVKSVHVWRERRASFGELVMQDSSPFCWLEKRAPACQLIALIDDATSKFWGRFAEHDSTEENLRTLGGWLRRYGRPWAHYTDKNSIFRTTRRPGIEEQLQGEGARSQFGRALQELGIEWIAAQSPQAKGRIERLFETLQDRLVKEMRLAGITTIGAANHFLEMRFLPEWEQRFTVIPRHPRDAHRRLGREHRLEEILSVRVSRQVADDHTVSWEGNRWGVPREEVCAGLRGARVEIERRLDDSHWLRFRGRYLHLRPCPEPVRQSASPYGLRPPGSAEQRSKPINKIKPKYHVPAEHPWRRPWKRTFLLCEKPDISTLR
ncbi:MAG TPA: ISNCY family transposase [Candidatus Acidoferrum sp.]|nr:ISNCY family transposase [Candidatus Acidoferrum sp.]